MNRERAKELAPIIAAYGEGKTIQIYLTDEWVDINDQPQWRDCSLYCIKPEPREYWIVSDLSFPSRSSAEIYRAQGRFESIIHVKEVL